MQTARQKPPDFVTPRRTARRGIVERTRSTAGQNPPSSVTEIRIRDKNHDPLAQGGQFLPFRIHDRAL
jgi:hypothetical protein